MIPVIIESPYQGDVSKNVKYLQECIKHSISLGEAPFASHQMYTQALNDSSPRERCIGMEAGYTWMRYAYMVAFYVDYGMSGGMHKALDMAVALDAKIDFRKLRKE